MLAALPFTGRLVDGKGLQLKCEKVGNHFAGVVEVPVAVGQVVDQEGGKLVSRHAPHDPLELWSRSFPTWLSADEAGGCQVVVAIQEMR